MLQILYKYFVLNQKVIIPGIGIFYIHRQPASLDFSNKTFVSPAAHIAFTPADAVPDTRFYSFVSREKQIEEADALLYFTNFINRVKESLQTKGTVELNGFGVLSTDVAGTLQFQAVRSLPAFLEDVAAERPVSQAPKEQIIPALDEIKDSSINKLAVADVQQSTSKRNYWWILALILAVGAVAGIIYYYMENGSLR